MLSTSSALDCALGLEEWAQKEGTVGASKDFTLEFKAGRVLTITNSNTLEGFDQAPVLQCLTLSCRARLSLVRTILREKCTGMEGFQVMLKRVL